MVRQGDQCYRWQGGRKLENKAWHQETQALALAQLPDRVSSTHETGDSDYAKYRGKCRELSEAAVAADPSLRLVRGYYYCPIWNVEEQHWWCVDPVGEIHDPSKLQYPSAGMGMYREFDGMLSCEQCAKLVHENDAILPGNGMAFCSSGCYARCVGF